jgi:hypothetical protein
MKDINQQEQQLSSGYPGLLSFRLPQLITFNLPNTAGWDVVDLQSIAHDAAAAAARRDPIVGEIRNDLMHFSTHRKGVESTHKTARVTLSTLSLCPSVIGPAAQATLFGYFAVACGPEASKLLSELYLDKRLSTRAQLLQQETRLILESYQMGAVTHNRQLQYCSQQMLTRLAGTTAAQSLLARTGGCL